MNLLNLCELRDRSYSIPGPIFENVHRREKGIRTCTPGNLEGHPLIIGENAPPLFRGYIIDKCFHRNFTNVLSLLYDRQTLITKGPETQIKMAHCVTNRQREGQAQVPPPLQPAVLGEPQAYQ